MSNALFVVASTAGPNRDRSQGTRRQPFWDDHATFIDRLVAEGRIVLAGPLEDEGGALLVVTADDEPAVRAMLAHDPWYVHGVLTLVSVKRWRLFIDERVPADADDPQPPNQA
ncbi:MAG TPA: YciI family protein [Thermomicrobiales bacterium]|nr:YciI family protein [Thermomicrobiales bacterium]